MSVMRCPHCERFVDTDFECGEEIGNMRRLMIWVCDRCAEKWHEDREAEQDAASAADPTGTTDQGDITPNSHDPAEPPVMR